MREIQQRLDALYQDIANEAKTFVGYPCTCSFDYSELYRFLEFPINNVGDPYAPSTYRVNTKLIEQEVLAWFAELTHADPGTFWGYITNGGSEGNLYGLYLARELMADGMVYYCEDTHYSVSKNLRMLKMPSITIRSRPNGELDYDDLAETIRIHREVPPIIMANIGTTMKEAHDDISVIRRIIRDLAIPRHYIHCDAALGGMILPFLENAPQWDFAAGIDSLAISGHKFIGSPIPCGIALAKKTNVDRIARSIEYVGTLDTTVTGSRNGITPIFLWYAIKKFGRDGFTRMARQCVETAQYAVERFQALGVKAWRNPFGVTVVFPRPPDDVLARWQIAVKDNVAHIICMQHVTRELIDTLTADISSSLHPKLQATS
ncbi:MAG: histidine decarboxylase [Planctomycetes bacterium]|nr:histidine decarboxylase [Planctomycetota bacterium]